MNNHYGIAVVIVGERNSGKTTTIKSFEEEHDETGKKVRQCKIGWRRITLFLRKLDALKCLIYFIPSSPTETNIPLENRLEKFSPEMLLVAEQSNGKEYDSTIATLNKKGYKVVEFVINSSGIWTRWTDQNKENVLKERAKAIGDVFRKHIIEKIQ
jgi:GTPase SAR1 family protein